MLHFFIKGVDDMNYFFKFLIPQLMEYFNNDKELLFEFFPKVIGVKYESEIKNLMKEDEIIYEKSITR